MGGVLPDADVEYYEHLLQLLKGEFPNIMIHGFSPTMIKDASVVSGISVEDAFERLKSAGLDTLPGTAAEILTDRSREIICPEKVTTQEWIDIVKQLMKLEFQAQLLLCTGMWKLLKNV